MSADEFEEFADAIASQSDSSKSGEVNSLSRIAILGGGIDARMYSALGLAEGYDVTMFSAYGAELDAVRKAGSVTLRGEGPVGSFHVDRSKGPSIKTTSALDEAVADAEAVVLTGPLHKQRTYTMVLAEHLRDGQIVVLPQSKSFAAMEAAWTLQTGGCTADVTLIEVCGSPYWVTDEHGTLILSKRNEVLASTLPRGRNSLIESLRTIFPNVRAVQSCLHSGFADASAVVEVPALLVGGPAAPDGGPKIMDGGVPLEENRTMRALIGSTHESIISKLWKERTQTASNFGIRDLPDLNVIIDREAGTMKGSGSRPVPNEYDSLEALKSGVIGSFIPLVSSAELTGQDMPATLAMIEMTMAALGRDLCGAGRRIDRIGITAGDVDTARKQFDQILKGGLRG